MTSVLIGTQFIRPHEDRRIDWNDAAQAQWRHLEPPEHGGGKEQRPPRTVGGDLDF